MNFLERKKMRTKFYLEQVYKQKQQLCSACNGSGNYDINNSPKCSNCNGTGKEPKRAYK